ncbi:hypothetical protein A5875_002813, partial [Enterococcus sp. 3H8_DIV0648]
GMVCVMRIGYNFFPKIISLLRIRMPVALYIFNTLVEWYT